MGSTTTHIGNGTAANGFQPITTNHVAVDDALEAITAANADAETGEKYINFNRAEMVLEMESRRSNMDSIPVEIVVMGYPSPWRETEVVKYKATITNIKSGRVMFDKDGFRSAANAYQVVMAHFYKFVWGN